MNMLKTDINFSNKNIYSGSRSPTKEKITSETSLMNVEKNREG
jgi:hypothetical protein